MKEDGSSIKLKEVMSWGKMKEIGLSNCGWWCRDLTIHMQHDRGNRGMSARVIQFYVPCWLDSAKCPSLKYKLVEVDHPGRKKFKTHRSRGNKKLMEEIDQEDMNEHPTMLSSFECKSVGLAVALSGNVTTNFGPVVPLEPLADPVS